MNTFTWGWIDVGWQENGDGIDAWYGVIYVMRQC